MPIYIPTKFNHYKDNIYWSFLRKGSEDLDQYIGFFKRLNDTFLLIEIYDKRNSDKTSPEGNLS